MDLFGRSLTKETDLSPAEFTGIVELAAQLRAERRTGREIRRLEGRTVALLFEKTSTRTRSAFEVAAYHQGAHVSYVRPGDSQLGDKESFRDTARVLGRMYDGIAYRGAEQAAVEALAADAGVPVWNALTDAWHPTQMLADALTISDHTKRPVSEVSICYLGDTRNNVANSLLVTGSLLGWDVRLAGPSALWPDPAVRELAARLAERSGARVLVTERVDAATRGAQFVYTDVWVSMGEPPERWAGRIEQLLPYQVTTDVLEATGNPAVKVLHCLPAMHDRGTAIGRELHARYGLDALEITDEVFESPASIVFDQAENRMHAIKALMVATLTEL